MTNLDLETKNMIYTISPPDHYIIKLMQTFYRGPG